MRKTEAAKRRQAAADRRMGNVSEAEKRQVQERAFVLGLADCCPRCGEELKGVGDEDAQRMHLRECKDSKKHQAHKKRQKCEQEKEAAEQKVDHAQSEMESFTA